MNVYSGVYTEGMGHGRGIEHFDFDPATGKLYWKSLTTGIVNPSFMVGGGERYFSVSETAEGGVCSLQANRGDGSLSLISQQPSHGDDPCHLTLARDGRFLAVANYSSGTIAVYPLLPDGVIGDALSVVQLIGSSVNPDRQQGPHAHMVLEAPDGSALVCADLGADAVIRFQLGEAGELTEIDRISVDPGEGPRHVAFSADANKLLILNEMGSSVVVTSRQSDGSYAVSQKISTLPGNFEGESSCAEILLTPDERFLYVSNRGDDSIASFSIDESFFLSPLQRIATGGKTPRHFAIDPSGRWLLAANQDSDSIVSFRRDPKTGLLEETSIVTEAISPVCIVFEEG